MQKQIEMGVLLRTFPMSTMVVKLEGEDRLRVVTILKEESIDESDVADWIKKGGCESKEDDSSR